MRRGAFRAAAAGVVLAAGLIEAQPAAAQVGPLQAQNGLSELAGSPALQSRARQSIAIVNAPAIAPLRWLHDWLWYELERARKVLR